MLKQPITDIFFDLDHTLWDFERNSALTYEQLFRDSDLEVDLDSFLEHYVPLNLLFWKAFREGRITKEKLRYERLKTVFDRMELPVSDRQINFLSEAYIENLSSHTHLLPNCMEILEYLHKGYKMHIITNGFEEVQTRKLQNSGIAHYFRTVVNSDRAGVKKPDPRIFTMAIEAAGIQPESGVMIGDSLEADIKGARAVGLQALHFNVHNDPSHGVCPVILDLDQIKLYL
ncbi:YjjG family noncanonical pyrimidine nucleotidase [Robiginitalea sp.]|uniref:YjjG family noncanonical pyrimidine nucleotidase n=1 Tax=Robiginitalea sp. TaxID=1902411 RepID=UPI003C35C025